MPDCQPPVGHDTCSRRGCLPLLVVNLDILSSITFSVRNVNGTEVNQALSVQIRCISNCSGQPFLNPHL